MFDCSEQPHLFDLDDQVDRYHYVYSDGDQEWDQCDTQLCPNRYNLIPPPPYEPTFNWAYPATWQQDTDPQHGVPLPYLQEETHAQPSSSRPNFYLRSLSGNSPPVVTS